MSRRRRYTNEQIIQYATEYIETPLTIRALSVKHDIERSSLHYNLKYILPSISSVLAKEVVEVAKRKKYEGECKGGRSKKKRRRE